MSKEISVQFAFRKAGPTDKNLILKSWLKTWRTEQKSLTDVSYYKQANSLFNIIYDKYGAIVACNPDDTDQIYSFAIVTHIGNSDNIDNEWVLFWIQTKSVYANLGIGRALYDFIKGGKEKGPICPFVRAKSRKYIAKYNILDAPLMIPQILNMKNTNTVNI